MAIDGDVHSGKQFRLAIAEETTFGTAVATGWKELLVRSISDIDFGGVVKDFEPRHAGKRVRDASDNFIQEAGSEFRMSFDCVLTDLTADLLMYGVLQNVSEAAGTPFKKDYVIDETTTQPDFSGNNGKFYTVLLHSPVTSESYRMTSAVLESLTINYDPGAAGGRATASGTFVSGFVIDQSTDSSGYTFTAPGTDYYKPQDITVKQINDVDVVLGGYSFTFTNGWARVGHDTTGDAETYALTMYDMSGSMTVKYDDNTKNLVDDFLAGTTRKLEIAYGSTGVDGAFFITINNALFDGNARDFANEMGVFLEVPFVLSQSSTTNAIDVEISNATDRTW